MLHNFNHSSSVRGQTIPSALPPYQNRSEIDRGRKARIDMERASKASRVKIYRLRAEAGVPLFDEPIVITKMLTSEKGRLDRGDYCDI